MPITLPKAPVGDLDVLRRGLAATAAAGPHLGGAGSPLEASARWDVSAPHQVFFAGLVDVVEDRITEAARPTAWRYLLFDGSTPVAAAELNTKGGGLQFSHVTNARAQFVDSTLEGIDKASALPAVQGQDFTLRLLTIPALSLVALWLHGDQEEIILPIRPAPDEVKAGSPYTEHELAANLRERAARLLDFDAPSPQPYTSSR